MLASDQGGKVVQPFLEQLVEGEHHSGAPQRRRFRPTRQRRLRRFDGPARLPERRRGTRPQEGAIQTRDRGVRRERLSLPNIARSGNGKSGLSCNIPPTGECDSRSSAQYRSETSTSQNYVELALKLIGESPWEDQPWPP
jgi:hypothetical protein